MNIFEFFVKCGFAVVDENIKNPMYKIVYGENNFFVDSSDSYWQKMTVDILLQEVLPKLAQQDFSNYIIAKARTVFIDEILSDLS